MLERIDNDGGVQTLSENEIDTLEEGDRIYLILEIDEVSKVEDLLRS